MAKLIAGLYEIKEKIGSGGGGIAFLGRHIRLNKTVVLKADKRKLSVGEEKLRREVDFLKGLNHTYIPQVYDFVQQDGITYTIMDYIEGESLDKVISREEKPEEVVVIKWLCQLLDALNYLHTRPPYGLLHADIKPGNIMIRSNGDVCLIDYNIALALGENGAARVGLSRGYASPEHYGSDSSVPGVISNASSTNSGNAVMLDVRSDIYSLGATVYHLVSGSKPAHNANEVRPLEGCGYSRALIDIIKKSMSPNPNDRFQTAYEMLKAVMAIPDADPGLIRYKVLKRIGWGLTAILMASGIFLITAGLKTDTERKQSIALAEESENALNRGNVTEAVKTALEAADPGGVFKPDYIPEARLALANSLGVYDLSDDYKCDDTLELPSAPFNLEVSSDGSHILAGYASEAAIYDAETLNKIFSVRTKSSAYADAMFFGNERMICAAENGVVCIELETGDIVWESVDALSLSVSKDGSTIAATDRRSGMAHILNGSTGTVMNDIAFGNRRMSMPENDVFANPGDYIFSLNSDGTKLAVSFDDGSLSLFDTATGGEMPVLSGDEEYRYYGGFYEELLSYVAEGEKISKFSLIDTYNNTVLAEYDTQNLIKLKITEKGPAISEGGIISYIDIDTMTENELAYIQNEEINGFCTADGMVAACTSNNGLCLIDAGGSILFADDFPNSLSLIDMAGGIVAAGSRDSGDVLIIKSGDNSEADLYYYDPSYIHDEARVNGDGSRVMLFDYRGFIIVDQNGSRVADLEFPDPDKIYDQQYKKEDSGYYLEVIWYDGTIRQYSAETGDLISEEQGDAPDKSLYEEFLTSKYRFESELHSPARVYLREGDKACGELEKDSYLTYITEVDDYLIAEYVNTNGDKFGILMDENLNKLAVIPGLCDTHEDLLLLDYNSGKIRFSNIYSTDELIAAGKEFLAGKS